MVPLPLLKSKRLFRLNTIIPRLKIAIIQKFIWPVLGNFLASVKNSKKLKTIFQFSVFLVNFALFSAAIRHEASDRDPKSMIDNDNRQPVVEKVVPLLLEHGIRNLTMDMVAHHLGISKRTLYEMFDSKKALVIAAMDELHRQQEREILNAISTANNAMEMMALSMREHRKMIQKMANALIYDLDDIYPELRKEFEAGMSRAHKSLLKAFEDGVSQGVFRDSVDYRITLRLFFIQIESLKRMEEIFPADVTVDQAITSISIGLLRSIATPKGMEILDRLLAEFPDNKIDQKQ